MRRCIAALAFVGLVGAAPTCSTKTCSELQWDCSESGEIGCFEHMNNHYEYTDICAEPAVGGSCSTQTGRTYAAAEQFCSAAGARLCSMTELLYNVAKGTGCNVETSRVWTLTTCDGGHVSQAGAFVESREDALEPECTSDDSTAGVVCCSTSNVEELCVEESVDECSLEDGTHSCCDDRKYMYNPVPCENMADCMTCVEPKEGQHGCNDGPYLYARHDMSEDVESSFVCCNMDTTHGQCIDGYCKHAPCMGSTISEKQSVEEDSWWHAFTDREWSNVRGDEWSKMHCIACHGNGCDQCEDGYFKYDHHSECLECGAMDNCNFCQDHQACAQCADGRQYTICEPLPGLTSKSFCCETDGKKLCSNGGCFEYMNYHFEYTDICVEAYVGEYGACMMPSYESAVTYEEAASVCSAKGARLCSMTELRHNVAKSAGCNVEHNRIWTLTTCEHGHVSQGGTIESTREERLASECTHDHQLAGVVCCSSDVKEEVCVDEEATRCSADEGTHSCCDDRKYTYNPVPCNSDFDCNACIDPPLNEWGHRECAGSVYYKKVPMEDSKYGVMCCNSEPAQVYCEEGYCTLAPCSGGVETGPGGLEENAMMSPAWSHVRGDEWERNPCKDCHGNGCDVCEPGFFKYDQHAECITCDVIDGCNHCELQGCTWCKDLPQTICEPLPGIDLQSWCCETGKPTMCQESIVKKPKTEGAGNCGTPKTLVPPTSAPPTRSPPVPATSSPQPTRVPPTTVPVTSAPVTQVPTTSSPQYPATTEAPKPTLSPDSSCTEMLEYGSRCEDAPGCCMEGYKCYAEDETAARCLDKCDRDDPLMEGWLCYEVEEEPERCADGVLAFGDECAHDVDCCSPGYKCYAEVEGFGRCLAACHPQDPVTEGWSCDLLSSHQFPEPHTHPDPCHEKDHPWGSCHDAPSCCPDGFFCYAMDFFNMAAQCRPDCDVPGWRCELIE
ncbi:hypothetical protein DIPPA_09459 [Diplonema papillatum]|nr:hypothetical protein DIPPA_09459 [Diplonema papillatum]